MKKFGYLFFALGLILSCKKEEPTPPKEPEPIKTGTIILNIQAYDSLGEQVTDNSGARVKIGSLATVTTDVSGTLTFNNLQYGDYFPSILRDGWSGAPAKISLSAPSTSVTLPIAQRSGFKAQSLTSQIVTKDSIIVSFILDKQIPAGKFAKIALIAGPTNALKFNDYHSADLFNVYNNTVTNLNIAKFANFKNWIADLDSNATFYINTIPVSYGEYQSNISVKPQLLGENLFPPDNWLLQKDWK